MKITIKDLKNKKACIGGQEWFIDNFGEDGEIDVEDLKSKLIIQKEFGYLQWLYESFNLSGEYISYQKNGNIWKKCYYKNGMRDGEYIEYDKNGYILIKCFYKNDILNGEYIVYASNNDILGKCCYKNGVKIK